MSVWKNCKQFCLNYFCHFHSLNPLLLESPNKAGMWGECWAPQLARLPRNSLSSCFWIVRPCSVGRHWLVQLGVELWLSLLTWRPPGATPAWAVSSEDPQCRCQPIHWAPKLTFHGCRLHLVRLDSLSWICICPYQIAGMIGPSQFSTAVLIGTFYSRVSVMCTSIY